jgi:hypothetical protein
LLDKQTFVRRHDAARRRWWSLVGGTSGTHGEFAATSTVGSMLSAEVWATVRLVEHKRMAAVYMTGSDTRKLMNIVRARMN